MCTMRPARRTPIPARSLGDGALENGVAIPSREKKLVAGRIDKPAIAADGADEAERRPEFEWGVMSKQPQRH